MTTLDVPCDGRVGFHRLSIADLRANLLADEARKPSHVPALATPCYCAEIIATYLRPVAYLARGLGT